MPATTITGAKALAHFGGQGISNTFSSSARPIAVGDFNRDGIKDIAISSPDSTTDELRVNAGVIYVIFGRQNLPSNIDTEPLGALRPDVTIQGAATGDLAGFALAAADINGDGGDDLLIGCPDADRKETIVLPALIDAGAVFALKGSATFGAVANLDLATSHSLIIYGPRSGEKFGATLAVGNLGGSISHLGAIADLVIGAPFSSGIAQNRPESGAVYLLYGKTTYTTSVTEIPLGTPAMLPDMSFYGAAGDHLGATLLVSNYDGDGFQDVILGAPHADRPATPLLSALPDTGAVFAFSGARIQTGKSYDLTQGQQDLSIYGAQSNSLFGFSLTGKDVTGDAKEDLIIGAPKLDGPMNRTEAGGCVIFNGGEVLLPAPNSGGNGIRKEMGNADTTIIGAAPGDRLGFSLYTGLFTTTGNTDPIRDLFISSPGAQGSKGEVNIFFGGSSLQNGGTKDLAFISANLKLSGPDVGGAFGFAIASGNFDNTNGDDLVISSPYSTPLTRSEAGVAYLIASTVQPTLNSLPVVTVNSPVGGSFAPGSTMPITWTATDADGNATITSFNIFLSTDGGQNFPTVTAANLPGTDRSFNFIVPNIGTTQGRIKVFASDNVGGTGFGISSTNFTISSTPPPVSNQPPTVQVAAPNGGETVTNGQNLTIAWNASDPQGDNTITKFDVALSTDGGATFSVTIAANLPGSSRFTIWSVPTNLVTQQARVKVIATDNQNASGSDISDSNFTTRAAEPPNQPPSVKLTSPKGGDSFFIGAPFAITWEANDPNGNNTLLKFDLLLSLDGGLSFGTTVITSIPGSQRSYLFTPPPGFTSRLVRLKIIAYDDKNATATDMNESNFAFIVPPVSVTLRTPVGGEVFRPGQQVNISWDVPVALQPFITGFDLLLSTNGGKDFNYVISLGVTVPSIAGNRFSHTWTVPDLCVDDARISVIASGTDGQRVVNSTTRGFAIYQPGPTLLLDKMKIFPKSHEISLKTDASLNKDEIRFDKDARIEISTNESGSQYLSFSKGPSIAKKGRMLVTRGTLENSLEVDEAIPENGTRLIKLINSDCSVTVIKVHRSGGSLIPVTSSPATQYTFLAVTEQKFIGFETWAAGSIPNLLQDLLVDPNNWRRYTV
jgi:hypothetical protein